MRSYITEILVRTNAQERLVKVGCSDVVQDGADIFCYQ
jgi:hypothetical protein